MILNIESCFFNLLPANKRHFHAPNRVCVVVVLSFVVEFPQSLPCWLAHQLRVLHSLAFVRVCFRKMYLEWALGVLAIYPLKGVSSLQSQCRIEPSSAPPNDCTLTSQVVWHPCCRFGTMLIKAMITNLQYLQFAQIAAWLKDRPHSCECDIQVFCCISRNVPMYSLVSEGKLLSLNF